MPAIGKVFCLQCFHMGNKVEYGMLDIAGMREHLAAQHIAPVPVKLNFPGDRSQGSFDWGED